jgi:pimeloyl-ACP methyl ester carboxylesterase
MKHRVFAGSLVAGLSIAALAMTSVAAHAAPRLMAVIVPPTKTSYTVDGQTVMLRCAGSGKIPVVFLAGGNDPSAYWNSIVTKLGPNVLTCLFDRAGVGGSTPSPTLLTPLDVAKSLNATLMQAGIGNRFVLVGHSIGGADALVFGANYPRKVAGAVLVDPSQAKFFEITHAEAVLAGVGYSGTAAEAQLRAVKHWPNVPLTVLARDPAKAVVDGQATAAQEAVWTAGARKYRRLSSRGTLTVVPNASHYIYIDAPDVTVAAIKKVLRQAR